MDATASPTYPHGFEVSLGGESTMRGVAEVRDESRITATRRRSDARLLQAPEHEAFDQRRSRKGIGELQRPGRHRGQAVQGGAQ